MDMDANRFKCTQCPKSFPKKAKLTIHMKTHSGIKYDCTLCEKQYGSKTGLYQHTKTIHGPKENQPNSEAKEIIDNVDISVKVNPKQGQNLNPNIKFDFTSFESQNKIKIKAEENASKINITRLLKDQPHYAKSTSFDSDCQIKHKDCQDKHFDKPDEMVQTEVEDDDKESCLWAHCDNLFEDEEREFTKASAVNAQSHLDTREIPQGDATLGDDHSEKMELEHPSTNGNNPKNSEVGSNAPSNNPSDSSELQNVPQNSGFSMESLVFSKKYEKTDLQQKATPEVANIVVEEFVCETSGCKKKFTTKGDLDEHMRSADGQNLKCFLCLKDFGNADCLKYHKEQDCGVVSESDESDEEGDEDDEDVEEEDIEDDFDTDNMDKETKDTLDKVVANSKLLINDVNQHLIKDVNQTQTNDVSESDEEGDEDDEDVEEEDIEDDFDTDNMDKETKDTLDKVVANSKLLTNDVNKHLIKDGNQTQTNDVQYSARNAIPSAAKDAQHSNIDGIQMTTKDVHQTTNPFIQGSTSSVQELTNNFQNSSQGTIPNTVKYQHSANDIKHPAKNGNPVPVNDENDIEIPSSDIGNPSGIAKPMPQNERMGLKSTSSKITETKRNTLVKSTNNELQNNGSITKQSQNIRPGIEVGHNNKAPREKQLTLKEKQHFYRLDQQLNQYKVPFSSEDLIQMSQENFDKLSAKLNTYQLKCCKWIRDSSLKVQSKPAPSNILNEKQPTDNYIQNSTIPKQMMKRRGEVVNNELLSKKIRLESNDVEDQTVKLETIQKSVLKGLNLGNNKENYEVIIEDGKVKLRIIGNHDNSSESLDEENDDGAGKDKPKWTTYSNCNKDKSFSNGGPTVPEGWKMCFEEQTMEGRKVMVAKYVDHEGKFYNRGPNGYDKIPNFQK